MPQEQGNGPLKAGAVALAIGTFFGCIAEPEKLPIQATLSTPAIEVAVEVDSLLPPLFDFNLKVHPVEVPVKVPAEPVFPSEEEGPMLA
jgi:hypothetical protein